MSIEQESLEEIPTPELPLSELGKRIELLRIERQIPKQRLARHAGTSRQQLWRVMTGKSELTGTLRERLALALGIPPSYLDGAVAALPAEDAGPLTMTAYLHSARCIERTLRTLPGGDEGSRLKRAILAELEDAALRSGQDVSSSLLDLRRRVLHGTL